MHTHTHTHTHTDPDNVPPPMIVVPPTPVPPTSSPPTNPFSCGGVLLDVLNGSFHSPGYPHTYMNNKDCAWFIRGPTGHELVVTFQDMQLDYRLVGSHSFFILASVEGLYSQTNLPRFALRHRNEDVASLDFFFLEPSLSTGPPLPPVSV